MEAASEEQKELRRLIESLEQQLTKKDAEHESMAKSLKIEENRLNMEKSKFMNEKEITLAKLEMDKAALKVSIS